MTVLGLVSAKGAPGVTTTTAALAAIWPSRVILADCDPAGADLGAGWLGGQVPAGHEGLLGLALAARRGTAAAELDRFLLRIPGTNDHLRLLPGLTDPAQLPNVAGEWSRIGLAFTGVGHGRRDPIDVLVDAGRVGAAGAPTELLSQADLVLILLHASLRSVAATRGAIRHLRSAFRSVPGPACPLRLVVVGDGPLAVKDIVAALDVPALGVIDHDATSARVLSEGEAANRRFDRSPLIRSARSLAHAAAEQVLRRQAFLTGGAPGSALPREGARP